MSDPLRSKLRIFLYASLALAIGLGLGSAFHWAKGGEAATLPAAAQRVQEAAVPAAATTEQQVASPSAVAGLAEVSRAFVAIAETVTPAVVSVSTLGNPSQQVPEGFEDLFGPFQQHPDVEYDVPLGRGSGFIVSEDGYILTNNHVVANAHRIQVELPDNRQYEAELIGRDPTTDVAVLKIEADDLPVVKIGDSETTAVGEFVMAIGNPGIAATSALPFTVTAGIVSATGRNLGIIQRAADGSEYAIEDLIQTDAVINPGNSGGPLVNYRGEVIGINTAIASLTGFYQGYGFAIPISLARDVMADLIEYGRVRRAALRVSVLPVSAADMRAYSLPDRKGAVVQDFPDDSPAEAAGIRPGDVIIAINDLPVDRVGQLQRTIASFEPGERVRVTVVRYAERMEFDVRLAEARIDQPEIRTAAVEARPGNTLLGIQVREADRRTLVEWGGFPDHMALEGVLVTRVAPYGPASNAGIRQRFLIQRVNGQPVGNVDEFDEALEDVRPGDVVSFDGVYPIDGDVLHRIINVEVPLR
ncbi:MAG: PDZ domain-containing protein [Gemmatimonadetes bacterium]|uniref:PDZ domain-containing protein n=1 Tax=Candidatus Kutchimonas denitrificans TaxID=3056748 RepID=A0AAE5C7R6_9BACT|nr:PDZ domain-containing protein [Gemmatimonadota bacterium]NIR73741.1 PDZ domain-containing protein [Candidatus Kutchimonas denitrificans]NIS03105.1 PDZ domain-containing protein [Gemmatimonadota bacterium]NIT69006.1 PDZ domain-containing protein [Gemmatimonadota bacterium]NIU54097.1 PDZ domain-containing protein [Gemmatimonadota bacterium]